MVHSLSGYRPAMLVLLYVTSNDYAQTSHQARLTILSVPLIAIHQQEIRNIYLHIYKRAYVMGDTLWFKVYIFDAAFLSASAKSGIIYIELANDCNGLVKRIIRSTVHWKLVIATHQRWQGYGFNLHRQ